MRTSGLENSDVSQGDAENFGEKEITFIKNDFHKKPQEFDMRNHVALTMKDRKESELGSTIFFLTF